MKKPGIVDTRTIFPEIAEMLISLLGSLNNEDWQKPTCYPNWKVRDIAMHLVRTGLGRLSKQRDGYGAEEPKTDPVPFEKLCGHIADGNDRWNAVTQNISPALILDLVSLVEKQLADFISSHPLEGKALYPVGWAGETESENWFDIAREYTERWHHQQQIREAVGAAGITERKYLYPVLDTLIRAVPFWYRNIPAAEGTAISIKISGEAGGEWALLMESSRWQLYEGTAESGTRVELDDNTAWKLLTRSVSTDSVSDNIVLSGNRDLAGNFINVRAIMMNC